MLPYYLMLIFTLLFAGLWQYANFGRNIVLYCNAAYKLQINPKQFFMVAAFLPMFLINALAYFSDSRTDYQHYYTLFKMMRSGPAKSSVKDISYLFINKLVIALGLNFQFVIIICSLIGYLLLMRSIFKYSKNYALSYLIYFCTGLFFQMGLNMVRQFIATAVILNGYRYIAEGKFFKYCLLTLVACTFHFSAVIMIPAYFILRLRIRASYYLIAAMILLPFNFLYKPIVAFLLEFRPSYAYLQENTFSVLSFQPRLIMGAMIVALIILFYYDQIVRSDPVNTIFANSLLIAPVIYLFCAWFPEYWRIACYFLIPVIFLIPNIARMERNIYTRILVIAIVCGYYLFFYGHAWAAGASLSNYSTIFH